MENETKIIDLFERNVAKGSYSLFDADYPIDIYLGTNQHGQPTLLISLDSERVDVASSKFIDVNYEKRLSGELTLTFALTNDNLKDLFYQFCADVIKSTTSIKPEDGFLPIVKRYEAWQNLFKKENNHLSEEEIRGLIGELLFIKRYMVPEYGPEITIESYVGAERAHKDFELGNVWHEVKTIRNGAHVVMISSLSQLDSDREGYLNVITLDTGFPQGESITLNQLVDEVKSLLNGGALLKFEDKLLNIGYTNDSYYDSYNYTLISAARYKVSESFPRLTQDTVPVGVVNAKYEIDLSVINHCKEFIWK